MNISVLEIKGLTKHFKRFTLGPLDLQIEKGTAMGLVGANGSGKSTLLRLLMNILQPDGGTIEFLGQRTKENETEFKERVGYAGELLEPFGHVTIKELSSMVSYWYPKWDNHRYEHFLKRYNIDEGAKYGKCSKGTKKKVEFIFSICHDPQLLLLDEPSVGVDISSQRIIKEDLMSFMENGEKSIIMATHAIDEIKSICDIITVLHEGRIIYSVNKDEIYENWARIWVSEVREQIARHPNVLSITGSPLQLVTNNLRAVEEELRKEQISITHIQRLAVEEVLEHYIETNSA
ncbi:hypothetical protein N752_27055 [Desulforamulus aquiferis]|nr:ABC transporter ATP-binding protein [Desulforamulus aquiferis]RYD02112.1 hypothetical protein N752_27055 [Desulforamulus aquiferis]